MMFIGVIEWSSDSLRFPSVILSPDVEGILRQTGRECRGFIFDDGGDADEVRDAFRPDMTYDELREWYRDLWDLTTDCALTIYRTDAVGAPSTELAYGEGDGSFNEWRLY